MKRPHPTPIRSKPDPFSEVRGTWDGQTAFVVSSGPSLRFVDTSLIKKNVIVVNAGILKFPDAEFYVSCDGRVTARKHWNDLVASKAVPVLNAPGFHSTWVNQADVDKVKDRVIGFHINHKVRKMNKEDTWLAARSTSAHAAVHFAHILGASPIVLLGNDCCDEQGKRHFYEFPGQPQDSYLREVPVDTGPGYFGWWQGTWAELAKDNPHIKILNASGGILDVFPRVKLEDL